MWRFYFEKKRFLQNNFIKPLSWPIIQGKNYRKLLKFYTSRHVICANYEFKWLEITQLGQNS
jgi:hypothetical protein